MCKAVLPSMRRRGSGRIVNISSVLGLIPAPFSAAYAASKHALEAYSPSLDHEVRGQGVKVVLVEPAYPRVSFDANMLKPDDPKEDYLKARVGADRLIEQAIAKPIRRRWWLRWLSERRPPGPLPCVTKPGAHSRP